MVLHLEAVPTDVVQPHHRAEVPIEPDGREVQPIPGLLHLTAVQGIADRPGPAVREVQATAGVRAEVHPGVQAIEVQVVAPEVLVVSEAPAVVASDRQAAEDPVAEVAPEVVEEADNNYINRHFK